MSSRRRGIYRRPGRNRPSLTAPTAPDAWAPPTSSQWTAFQAAFAEAQSIVYILDGPSLQRTPDLSGGITSGEIGFAHNWSEPSSNPAISDGVRRPVLGTLGGITCAIFDGDRASNANNNRLVPPHTTWAVGTAAILFYLDRADDGSPEVVDQINHWRVHARAGNAQPEPRVRAGNNVRVNAGGASSHQAWVAVYVQWRLSDNLLRVRRHGGAWVTGTLDATTPWLTESIRNQISYIGRGGYDPDAGEPFKGGVRARIVINRLLADAAEEQALVDMTLLGTGMSETVSTDPDPNPPPEPSPAPADLVDPLRTVNVSSDAALTTALNNALAGDHIVLANGTYSTARTISPNGTSANPLVIRAANPHGAVITGRWTVNSNRLTIYQLRFQSGGGITLASCGFVRILRNEWINTSSRPVQFSNGAYDCEVGYSYIVGTGGDRMIDVRPGNNGSVVSSNYPRRMWIHHNYFLNQGGNGAVVGIGNNRFDSEASIEALLEWNLGENLNGQLTYFKCSDSVSRFNTYRRTNNNYPSNTSPAMCRSGRRNKLIANASVNGGGFTLRSNGHEAIGNFKDSAVSHGRWTSNSVAVGPIDQDDYLAQSSSTPTPRGKDCLLVGNIGHCWIGSGSTSAGNAVLPALRTTVRNHSGGSLTIDTAGLSGGSGARAQQTVDQRNQAPGIEVPLYSVIPTPALAAGQGDIVGPWGGL